MVLNQPAQGEDGMGSATACGEQLPLEARARQYAVSLLTRRDYSRAELSDKLSRKLAEPSAASSISNTIDWLCDLGYLNDQRYSEMLVRTGIAKGQGYLRIRQEMCQKRGLPAKLVEAELENIKVDWVSNAVEAAARKFKQPPTDHQARAKVCRFLLYRGFSSEQVYAALDEWQSRTS